jgi:hypothetical protein
LAKLRVSLSHFDQLQKIEGDYDAYDRFVLFHHNYLRQSTAAVKKLGGEINPKRKNCYECQSERSTGNKETSEPVWEIFMS